ncbi:MAG: thymidine kinase [Bacilli bacterium]|nr:thymidine kinase [Bacilli bacterium]
MAKMTSFFSAMSGGKTTVLLQVCFNYELHQKKVLLIKPKIDTKGGKEVSSRLNLTRQVDILLAKEDSLLVSYFEQIRQSDVIVIDESQFLTSEQVKELWAISKELDKPVLAFCLKGNFQGELFLGTQNLLALSDKIEELPVLPICSCGKKAVHNARKVNGKFVFEGEEVVIDDGTHQDVEYVPICGQCFYEEMKKQDTGIARIMARSRLSNY